MKTISLSLYLSLLLSASVSAFAADVPTVESATAIVKDKYKSNDCVSVVDVKKEDGQAMEYGGAKAYDMRYIASIKLNPGCYGFYNENRMKFDGRPNRNASKLGEALKSLGYRALKEGEQVNVRGRINFNKTEKGWQGYHEPTV